ncbi:carbon-nitrogen hydrolase family protein [Subtercola vilae]|uniref:Carbon-nitrogen hydrolase family protein n=1 Tax=Subtercola vilae TaxID=2056433 RepID=A0A4T2C1D5_9MICO|nr:carbon-nitrogen hydrolase family protein [Subtercola vilae]TIH36891.1 carbon-nitrogen hydrolase family protein [Subtercola vilae]
MSSDTSGRLGIAVAQFAPSNDKAANLTAIRALASTAAERGAQLVVFPEYSAHFAEPLGPSALAAAEPRGGEFVQGLGVIAAELGIHLVAGVIESSDASHYFNTLVALDPAGVLVASYRKIHLYDAFGARESDWMHAGTVAPPETFTLGGFTVGLQTCYDLRFPEVTRWLVDAGVDLVLVPSEWVPGPTKERHWNTLLAARAIENTVFVAAADHTAPGGVGLSQVLDPTGAVLSAIGAAPDVAVAFLDPARLAGIRRTNPALALRRFSVTPR